MIINCSIGKYVCKECGHDLFRSEAKFGHHTPWPAFSNTILSDSVTKKEERKGALKVIHLRQKIFSLFYVIDQCRVWLKGSYCCSACEHPLFSSSSKYRHGTPWPAFHKTLSPNSVAKLQEDEKTYKVCLIKDIFHITLFTNFQLHVSLSIAE